MEPRSFLMESFCDELCCEPTCLFGIKIRFNFVIVNTGYEWKQPECKETLSGS